MLRRIVAVSTFLLLACDSTEPSPFRGIWSATTFIVQETGKQPVDVIAQRGGLTITISSSNRTVGSLVIPGSVTKGATVNASMTGTASVNGNSVQTPRARVGMTSVRVHRDHGIHAYRAPHRQRNGD